MMMAKRRRRSWTRIAAFIGILSLAAAICETFIVQGLLLPVRIQGGSMAPHLLGQHLALTCDDCRFRIRFDEISDTGVVCPNCGHIHTHDSSDTSLVIPSPAHRVLVDRVSLKFRSPKRWEIIAFRRPKGQKTVKRLIGLPGETVRIDQGDVWIDDKRVSRPLPILQSMLLPVHSDSFQRAVSELPRWRADENQLLTYHHAACLPLPIGRAEKPIFDSYGFNQTLSRDLKTVPDVVLSCRVKWSQESNDGKLLFRFPVGRRTCEFAWERDSHLGLGIIDESTYVSVPSTQLVAGEGTVTVGYVDGNAFFALNGKTRLQHGLDDNESSALANPRSLTPFAIGIPDGAKVEVTERIVARDIHYFANRGQQNEWQLGSDQFLLLGDNVPVSEDARQDSAFGVIRFEQILGRVISPAQR